MALIEFKNLPDTTTPITAENLNYNFNELNNNFNELNDRNVYSTEEKVIGTWIDGKPIYRKTVYITGITTTDQDVTLSSLGIANVETIWINLNASFWFRSSLLGSGPIGDWESGSRVVAIANEGRILYKSSNNAYSTAYITLEYTKITD